MNAELIPHLFRREYSKIVAVLCRHFGLYDTELAEDIASDTFVAALQSWPFKGIPSNPSAWLYTVALNKARNALARQQFIHDKIAENFPAETVPIDDVDLSTESINDSQLRMLFAVCNPSISQESQIALGLRVLCGFGIDEIATAFLTNKETINKRLTRAREKLREDPHPFSFPGAHELAERLPTVLKTIYLLFSEGYYSESTDEVLREDLCFEAMQLAHFLTTSPTTATPATHALLALMCFQASRFKARRDHAGSVVLYDEQDITLWDNELISQGAKHLHLASVGTKLSTYHLEAFIAWWHTKKEDTPEKWTSILELYNHLLMMEYSPVAALNRTLAYSKVYGSEPALEQAKKLNLITSPFYFVLLAELYKDLNREKAIAH